MFRVLLTYPYIFNKGVCLLSTLFVEMAANQYKYRNLA